MALHIANAYNVTDNAGAHLSEPVAATTAVIGGRTYVFVSGNLDDGVSVFSVATDGTLGNVTNITDDAVLKLNGTRGVATATVGGTTYLFVAGQSDDGVSVFSVSPEGFPVNVANVGDDATLELDDTIDVTTAVIGGTTYLFVAGHVDDGVAVFSVAANGALTNVANVTDSASLELNGARALTTAVVGGTTYLFVIGDVDNGVSVFAVAANGTLTNTDNVDAADLPSLELLFAQGVTTAVVDGTTYLFVSAFGSGTHGGGVSVFEVAADGTLTNVDNVSADDPTLTMAHPGGIATTVVAGITYLIVTAMDGDSLTLFSVGADGTLTFVDDILDDDNNPAYQLGGAFFATTTTVSGGTSYLFSGGTDDDGMSFFYLTDPPPVIASNGGVDTGFALVAENATAVTTVTATDPDNDAVIYSISGGADAARFQIDPATGALSFITAPNFEAPADADGDNIYVVRVRAADAGSFDEQTLSVIVTNVNEPLAITSNGGGPTASVTVTENSAVVTTVAAGGPDATPGYAIVGGADAARFHIDFVTGALSFVTAPNFEAPGDANADNIYDVTVRAADGAFFDDQALSVSVTNINDAPVAQGGHAGGNQETVIAGTLAASDDDSPALTYSLVTPAAHGTVAVNADGSFSYTPAAGYFGADSFAFKANDGVTDSNVATFALTVDAVLPHASPLLPQGDGHYDQDHSGASLLRHDDGTLRIEDVTGSQLTAHTLGALGTEWRFISTGDFNGNGMSDLLSVRSDGMLLIHSVANNQVSGATFLGALGTDWAFRATGDFNHDGTADLLWQQDGTGMLLIHDIQSNQVVGASFLGAIGTDWTFLGTGDFNHDGTADLLWQQGSMLLIHNVENNQVAGSALVGAIGSNWRFAGTGDFNGDLTADLLFQADDGTLRIYDIVNNHVVGSHVVETLANDTYVAGITDYTGDGTDDLLLRHDDGRFELHGIGNNMVNQIVQLGQVGPEWHVV